MSSLRVEIAGAAGSFPISAAFEAGNGVTALFGRSGAGKTSLLKMIAGTLRPLRGHIDVAGRVLLDTARGIDVAPAARQVGFVFQDGRLFPHMSVRRNLLYARWAGRRAASRPFDEVVSLLGLGDLLDRAPDSLSGGERQRVAIGRALLSDPALLIMDEPLSSLDRPRRQEILPYIEAIRAEARIPVLYVSHDIDEVARLADTLVVMEAGGTIASGAAGEVFRSQEFRALFGQRDVGTLLDGRVSAVDAGFDLAHVTVAGMSLEVPAGSVPPGQEVRLRILAGDVAIATVLPNGLSVRNILRARICGITDAEPGHSDVDLQLGGAIRLRARITRKSRDELALLPGMDVYALLKAVSVERHPRSAL